MNQAALQGSVVSDSYQPDIVGVRNQPKHYFAWRLDGSPDSLRYIGTNNLGFWDQNVGIMNSQSVLSGVLGPKPGFRYAANDSCFAIYPVTGPYDVWAAYGCSGPVSVETNDLPPVNYSLSQNYPNPFNPSTKITFELPGASNVTLNVFNILGELVAELVNQSLETGRYEYQFNSEALASGIYFYKLEAREVNGKDHFVDVKKMILLR